MLGVIGAQGTIGGFNPVFVFVAYAVVWLLLFGYVFYLARRQADVRAEIAELRQEMTQRPREQGPAAPPSPRREG
ncbi:MAG: CcmD family protein [Chloroflexi bacterium]|nr:CcmD family protein [Chloroflexota bacterium]